MENKPKNIFSSISQYLTAAKLTDENKTFQLRQVKSQGNQFYTTKDLAGITNPIAQLIRLIFIYYSITDSDFVEGHYKFKRDMGKTNSQINQDLGNLRKCAKADRMTLDRIDEMVSSVDLQIIDVSLTIYNKKTGETNTFHSSDAIKYDIPISYDNIVIEEDSPLDDD